VDQKKGDPGWVNKKSRTTWGWWRRGPYFIVKLLSGKPKKRTPAKNGLEERGGHDVGAGAFFRRIS